MSKNVKLIAIIAAGVLVIAAAGITATLLLGKTKNPEPGVTPTPVVTSSPEEPTEEPTIEPTEGTEETPGTPTPTEEDTPEPTQTPDTSTETGVKTPEPTNTGTSTPVKTPSPKTPAPTETPEATATWWVVTTPPPTPKPTPTPDPTEPPPGEEGYRTDTKKDLITLIQEVKNNLPRGYFGVERDDHWNEMLKEMNNFCSMEAKGESVPNFENGYEWTEQLDTNKWRTYEIYYLAKAKFTVPDNWTPQQIFNKLKADYFQHLYNQNTVHGAVSVYCTGKGTCVVVVYFYNGMLSTRIVGGN
jgi:hypothetical protein